MSYEIWIMNGNEYDDALDTQDDRQGTFATDLIGHSSLVTTHTIC